MPDSTDFRPVVIAPTFNNDGTLQQVLRGIDRAGLKCIVIDDGCADGSALILDAWQFAPGHILVKHARNQGKAAALRSGFARAGELGFTHAVTIDTDGQLNPDEIPNLLKMAARFPDALVVGCRDDRAHDYPMASLLGRRATNLLVSWECGIHVPDTQCGFRVYPLQKIRTLHCQSERFGFETEILTRAAWAGIPIKTCNVQCIYKMPEGRVSHFRPWADSFAGVGMHLKLLAGSMVFVRTRHSIPRRFIWWISPVRATRAMRDDPQERARCAKGLAIGVFIANLPLYGIQTLLSLFAARRLKLNPIPVVVGSHLSTPPLGALLIAMAITAGHWILHGTLPNRAAFNLPYGALIRSVLLEWTIGSVVCGTILAALTYFLTRLLLRSVPARKREDEANHPAEQVQDLDPSIAEPAA